MSGDRKDGSDASIAIEDLNTHPRGSVGVAVAIHAELGDAAIVGGIGNVEPVIRFAQLQFASRLYLITVAVMALAFCGTEPQSIRRKRNSCGPIETFSDD